MSGERYAAFKSGESVHNEEDVHQDVYEEESYLVRGLDSNKIDELDDVLEGFLKRNKKRVSKLETKFKGFNPSVTALLLDSTPIPTDKVTTVKLDAEYLGLDPAERDIVHHPLHFIRTIPQTMKYSLIPVLELLKEQDEDCESGETDVRYLKRKMIEYGISRCAEYANEVYYDTPEGEAKAVLTAIKYMVDFLKMAEEEGIDKINITNPSVWFPGTGNDEIENEFLGEFNSLVRGFKNAELGKYQLAFFMASHKNVSAGVKKDEFFENIWRDVLEGMRIVHEEARTLDKMLDILGEKTDLETHVNRMSNYIRKEEDAIKDWVIDALQTRGKIYEMDIIKDNFTTTITMRKIPPSKYSLYDIEGFDRIGGYRDKVDVIKKWDPAKSLFPTITIMGPAGTGKSKMAKAKLKELAERGYTCIMLGKTNHIVDPKKIGTLIKELGTENVVVLYDDAESLFRNYASDPLARNYVLRMLEDMTRASGVRYVLTINPTAAFNYGDEATQRRMGLVVTIPLPGEKDKKDILRVLSEKYNLHFIDNPLLDYISRNTEDFSGANLEMMVKYAAEMVRNGEETRDLKEIFKKSIDMVRDNYIEPLKRAETHAQYGSELVWRTSEDKVQKDVDRRAYI